MTELEKYIGMNLESFDSEPVPSGSRERFMAAVAAEKKTRRIKVISMAFTGMAAAFTLFLMLFNEPDLSRELKRQHTRLAAMENKIMNVAESVCPFEVDIVANTIRSITFEAIPLEDQLPEDLSEKDRIRILNDYYDKKYSALESLLAEL